MSCKGCTGSNLVHRFPLFLPITFDGTGGFSLMAWLLVIARNTAGRLLWRTDSVSCITQAMQLSPVAHSPLIASNGGNNELTHLESGSTSGSRQFLRWEWQSSSLPVSLVH